MADYRITIGGGDATCKINSSSVFHKTSKNESPSVLDFSINVQKDESRTAPASYVESGYVSSGYIAEEEIQYPYVNQNVEFYINDVLQFGGKIINVNREIRDNDHYVYKIQCQDYSRLAQMGDPIAEIYKNMTAYEIIEDITTRYSFYSQFDRTNVNCDIEIDYLFVDHKTLWEVLSDLSKRTAYDFYIDDVKKIYFYEIGTITGELITEENKGYIKNTLKVKEDISKMFNFLIVQGGEYDGSETITLNLVADGTTEVDVSGRYSGVQVYVGGVQQDVGVFGLDDERIPSVYQCLYDFNGQKIIFDETTKPASGTDVTVTGNQKLRVIVQVPEASSIDKYGIVPKKIKDISLKTKDSAFQYARAQLLQYADELESGSFKTWNKSFRAGQRITIDYMGEQSSFDVKSTSTVFIGDDIAETTVQVQTAEVIDAIQIMANLVNQNNASQSAEEILDVLRLSQEKINIGELVSANPNTYNIPLDIFLSESVELYQDKVIQYVYGDYLPDFTVEKIFTQNEEQIQFQSGSYMYSVEDNKRNAIYSGSTYG